MADNIGSDMQADEDQPAPPDIQDAEPAKEPEVTQEPERDYEGEARKQGWAPKDEFFGNPDGWRSAEEFVRRGEEVLPIVKAKYDKRIEAMEDAAQQQQTDFDKRIQKMEKMNQHTLAMQAQNIRDEYGAKKRAAVQDMDTEAFDAAETGERQAMDGMRQRVAEANKEPERKGPNIPQGDQAAINEWMAENQWFNNDRVLNAAADEQFEVVNQEMPGANMTDRLAEVRRRVAEDFPKKFGIRPNSGNPSRVEGGNRQAGGGSHQGKFSALPAECKTAFSTLVSEGVYENNSAGKEEYAKSYEEMK